MGYETINVMPVTPRIGAEVAGLTLARPDPFLSAIWCPSNGLLRYWVTSGRGA
jgi:hypothetical protein